MTREGYWDRGYSDDKRVPFFYLVWVMQEVYCLFRLPYLPYFCHSAKRIHKKTFEDLRSQIAQRKIVNNKFIYQNRVVLVYRS